MNWKKEKNDLFFMTYNENNIFDSVFILVLMVGLTLLLIRTKWKISRAEGALLVSINLIRWYFDFAG